MNAKENREKYDFAVKQLEENERKFLALKKKHPALFKEIESLTDTRSQLLEQVKTSARGLASEGKTILTDDEMVTISVIGKKVPFTFNFATAEQLWTKQVLEKVEVKIIDKDLVNNQIKQGYLSQELADAARNFGTPIAPSVFINFKRAP